MGRRRRLDTELVRRGLAAGRDVARRLVEDGVVLVNGAVAAKAASQVDPGDAITVAGDAARWVGRGGEKMQAALDAFDLTVAGRRCFDIGASTGGFTDCLLHHGAARVVAVDVGTAQLHERLRRDDRVVSVERCDVRGFDPGRYGGPAPLVVCDVSFISLRTIMPALEGLLAAEGDLIVLVKPQFEVGRRAVSKGRGVISDPSLWEQALRGVLDTAAEVGLAPVAAIRSPLRGGSGNVEFLVWLRRGPDGDGVDIADLCRSEPIA